MNWTRVVFMLFLLSLAGATGAASGCAVDGDEAPLAGGEATILSRSSHAYGFPAPNLDADELARHLEGDVAFEAVYVSAPAVVNPGLGPLFNNTGCANCHVRDGRGMPVAGGGAGGSQLRLTVSCTAAGEAWLPGGPILVPDLGIQLQDHAIYGYASEATVGVGWNEIDGWYGDGEAYSLRWPRLEITMASGQPLPDQVLRSARVPPPVFGLGLLEAVPEADIRSRVDPTDADGDGISGRANTVWDAARSVTTLGRFGWKANVPSLLQATASDLAEDMGVTSPMFPEPDGSVDVGWETLNAASFYTQTLGVPSREGWDRPEILRGERIFREVDCARCHVETLRTGEHPIRALRHQTIHPYTDLLLHYMGLGLADDRHEFDAWDNEWRTPPLWGLGLAQTVLPYASFLHDGRARTLEEAILWHGGEGEASKEAFRTMTASDREALLAFLRSL